MIKHISKISIIIVFFVLTSCASAPAKASMEAPMAYETSQAARFSESSSDQSSDVRNNERMITYTISLGLFVQDTEDTRDKLLERVKNTNGFIVRESENIVTSRIPAENMDDYLRYAKTLGKIESESKTGTDITDQYRDNVIRLDSLKNVRNRYLALLDQANSVSDILNIEKELERINTNIELLEGRIKYAEDSVAYSNVTVRFREKSKPGPVGWVFYGLYHGIKWLFVWN